MEAKAGFAISLVAGIIIPIVDIIVYAGLGMIGFLEEVGMAEAGFIFDMLFGLGILWAILVLVSAALIASGKTTAGGVLVILFSLFSLGSLSLGGFVIGLILGIVGGALGIAKK